MLAKILTSRMVFSLLWLLAAGTGFALILKYQSTGGRAGVAPEHWPAGAQITPAVERNTLIMFAHPNCPCTRASVEELNHLLVSCGGQVAAHVIFFQPETSSNDWLQSDLWHSAAAIPNVVVHADTNGMQARLFGAETSGHVLLYDAQGRLLFTGGITGGRGHVGDNLGEETIRSLLAGRVGRRNQTPVYGCSLLNTACASGEIAK